MPDKDILKHSVTLDDYSQTPQSGAFFFTLSSGSMIPMSLPPDLEGLSVYASDLVTIGTIDHEPLWAGAVSIAITKVSSLSFEIQGDIPLRTRRGHELLMHFDADRGYVSGMSKILQDFILTNNGAFVEIVRVSTSMNSQIIGLIPLDSLRCTRTGNPDIPVVYKDLKGRSHELKAYEVMEFVDMPSNRAELFGSGRCAASRAYRSIYKLAAIDNYLGEKVTGRHPTAIQLVNGLNDPQLRSILTTGQSEADARGAIAYMGAIIATVPGDKPVSVGTIPLAEFPDNFDRGKETDLGILSYANALGIDVQDIQPLTGRALGTGAQSEVLNEKAKGKNSFRQQFSHGLSTWVLPDMTTFIFVEKDWRDKNLTSDHNQKTEAYVADSIANGIITAPQGLQVLVDENIYPKEFLPVDTTPDTTLTDDEKPGIDVPAAVVPPDVTPPAVSLTVPIVKEFRSIQDLLEREEQAAIAIVNKLRTPLPAEVHLEQKAEKAEKAIDFQLVLDRIKDIVDGSKQIPPNITVINNIPPQDAPVVNVPGQPPANITVNVPEQKAGDITVNLPETLPAHIVVNVPEQKAADIVVNVPAPAKIPAPVVNVTPEITVNIPDTKGEFVVKRDNWGIVTGIEEK